MSLNSVLPDHHVSTSVAIESSMIAAHQTRSSSVGSCYSFGGVTNIFKEISANIHYLLLIPKPFQSFLICSLDTMEQKSLRHNGM